MTASSTETGSEFSGPAPWVKRGHSGGDGKYSAGILQFHDYAAWDNELVYWPGYTTGLYTAGYADLLAPGGRDPNLLLRATNKLIEEVRGHSLNLGNDIGTMKQTVNMVESSARKLAVAVLKLKQGKIPDALRALGVSPRKATHKRAIRPVSHDDAAGLWLELQYGWKPLLDDVHEAAKFMAKTNNAPRGFKVTAYEFARMKILPADEWIGSPWVIRNYWDSREEIKLIAYITENLPAPRSLELDDPLSIAWEMLPWSFIVDWFIPIGNYLEAMHIAPAIKGKFITCRKTIDYRVTAWSDQPAAVHKGQRLIYNARQFNRTVSNELSVPLPALQPINRVVSWARAENALALLSQAIARK